MFHGVVIIEVILRQICHDRHINRDAVQFVLMQCMACDFEDDIVDFCALCIAEKSLHSIGRSNGRVQIIQLPVTGNFDDCGRKHRGFLPRFFEDFIQVIHGCRFAVRAGNSDDAQAFGWIAVSGAH